MIERTGRCHEGVREVIALFRRCIASAYIELSSGSRRFLFDIEDGRKEGGQSIFAASTYGFILATRAFYPVLLLYKDLLVTTIGLRCGRAHTSVGQM